MSVPRLSLPVAWLPFRGFEPGRRPPREVDVRGFAVPLATEVKIGPMDLSGSPP